MADAATRTQAPRPLVVRLCNWVGEAVLSLPGLIALEQAGYELHLIGKRWAGPLFEAHGWKTYTRPGKRLDVIKQMRALQRELSQRDPSFNQRPNTLLFTSSFSSALEARLAGLKPVGFPKDGRRFLLARSVVFDANAHAADHYWALAQACIDPRAQTRRPDTLGLRVTDRQRDAARALLQQHGVQSPFIVLCPLSGADDPNGTKQWPPFPSVATRLSQMGYPLVICPGPGEEEAARSGYSQCTVIPGVDLGLYAALMQQAQLVISNDTGPGHVACSCGARLVSIFGPVSTAAWSPVGHHVEWLFTPGQWPTESQAVCSIERLLAQAAGDAVS
jgi:heptosyltransferase-2